MRMSINQSRLVLAAAFTVVAAVTVPSVLAEPRDSQLGVSLRPVRAPLVALETVATTVLGLMPLRWEGGVGADISARTAAAVVGGLWSCMFLALLVIPAAYTIWRQRQIGLEMRAATATQAGGR
jgi:hypothetical protein